jgi:hypothetical protein
MRRRVSRLQLCHCALALVFILGTGCAGVMSEPKTSQDRFTGTTINATRANDLPTGFLENYSITCDMRQDVGPSGDTNYFMVVGSFSLHGPVLVPNIGESLYILADGTNRFSFTTQLRHNGGSYFYPATEEQLRVIARAEKAEMRVIQHNGVPLDKTFAAKNLNNFRQFVAQYIDHSAQPPALIKVQPPVAGKRQ